MADPVLRIWHTINVPRAAFRYEVPDVAHARMALKALAEYDLFLGDGEDKPWSTVGGRANMRRILADKSDESRFVLAMMQAYDRYQLEHSPSGVPFVVSNAQGCEVFEDGEWCEYHDENDNEILDEPYEPTPARVRLAATSVYQATTWQRAVLAAVIDGRSFSGITYVSLGLNKPFKFASSERAITSAINSLLGKNWIEKKGGTTYRLTKEGRDATCNDLGHTP